MNRTTDDVRDVAVRAPRALVPGERAFAPTSLHGGRGSVGELWVDGSRGWTLQGLSSRLWNLWRTDVRAGPVVYGLSTGGGRRAWSRGTGGGRAGVVHRGPLAPCTGRAAALHSGCGDVHRCPQVVHRAVGCRPATVTFRQLSVGVPHVALCPQSCPHAGDEIGQLTCSVYSKWFAVHAEIWPVGQISGVSESLCGEAAPCSFLCALWTAPGDDGRPWWVLSGSSDLTDPPDRCTRPWVTHTFCGQVLWTVAHRPWRATRPGVEAGRAGGAGGARRDQPREVCLIRLVSSVTWL